MNEMTIERKSNLVLPSQCVELDREEMAYITGGEVISLALLYNDQKAFHEAGILAAVTASLYYSSAAMMLMIPFTGWAASVGLSALGATYTILSNQYFSNYGNACEAINIVKHFQEIGKSFTVYRYETDGYYTYMVE